MPRLLTLVACSVALLAVPAAAAPALDGVSGPEPLAETDLAGTWDFGPEGQEATTIEVPGGGWFKQGFDVPQATYERAIAVPDVAAGQVTRLELGAVNHQATVYVDGREVGTRTTSYMPQSWDLSAFVTPGATHRLRIVVKGRNGMTTQGFSSLPTLPGYAGPTYLVPTGVEWSEGTAQGIFRSARLRVYPPVYVSDAFVRPSVAKGTLSYDAWVTNASAAARTVTLTGELRSAWSRDWEYPELPVRTVDVAPRSTKKVTVSVPWALGEASWWWPNVPFRAGYRAELHDLALSLGGAEAGRWRFGFREIEQVGTRYELNGVRVNFRGDSLGEGSYDRIDRGGKGDAFDTFPGFLPPSPGNGGWPQAITNYQRLGFNTLRIHQIPASPYMLDVADETGMMIIGESAIRGSQQRQDFRAGEQYMVDHVRDLVLRDRNHASVLRWSQANEPDVGTGDSVDFQRKLYDTIKANDATRPISIDVTSSTYEPLSAPDFSVYQHYFEENGTLAPGYTEDVHPREDRPFGRGEFIWPFSATPQAFTWFGTATARMREKDASDIRPYAMASAWPAVVPGVRRSDYVTEENTPILFGEDNLPDPWSNPQIQRIQKAFDPLLVADTAYWNAQKRSDAAGRWPSVPVALSAGKPATRTLVVFNDTFAGRSVDVTWELRANSASGAVLKQGAFTADVPLGGRVTREITFTPTGTRVVLVLRSSQDGKVQFADSDTVFEVLPA